MSKRPYNLFICPTKFMRPMSILIVSMCFIVIINCYVMAVTIPLSDKRELFTVQ